MKTAKMKLGYVLSTVILAASACSTGAPSASGAAPPAALPSPAAQQVQTSGPAPARASPSLAATVTPTVIYAPHNKHVWPRNPRVIIVSTQGDPRVDDVMQAAQWWNDQLQAMGTPLRLGPISVDYSLNPNDLVPAKDRTPDPSGDPGPSTEDLPAALNSLDAEIIVDLTGYDLTSRNIFRGKAGVPDQGGQDLILIKDFQPSVSAAAATGALRHELGHAVGLMHDNYPLSVMCGPPWMDTCRARQLVLDPDKEFILSEYPPDWKPAP